MQPQPQRSRIRFSYLALISLAFTYLFFVEYLSPLRLVHIPYDLEGFHYPLADYAFRSLKQGHFPQWDPTIYSGISFVGNTQAALFYPPTWLLFAANWGRPRLSYQSLQVFEIAHVWLAFLLCFLWLRGRKLCGLACLLGAGAFAYGGYMCLQLQHLGLIAGFPWYPLGFMAIDEANDALDWRPLWKLVAASALCFLAGYPPMWVVFVVCMTTYAVARPWRWVPILGTAAALGVSLVVAMIQALPAMESTAFMIREPAYGFGVKDPAFFLSYLFPNFFNFGLNVPILENFGKEYLYLGAPALLGITLLFRRPNPRTLLPLVATGAVSLIFMTNPYQLVWDVIQHSSLLAQVCRSWYFLTGLAAVGAPLAAYGLDDFLRRPAIPARREWAWLALALALMGAWAAWELVRYLGGDVGLASGWRSVFDPAITVAILAVALYVFRAQRGALRAIVAIALLLATGVDCKVFGTRKRFNAGRGSGQAFFSATAFPGFDTAALRELKANRNYRILLDSSGPATVDLRHAGLTTPQGFDPFLPTQYRELLQGRAHFVSDREFELDPSQEDTLKLLGVRYVVTYDQAPMFPRLVADPRFRPVGTGDGYYRVFEYQSAQPPYGFASGSGGSVELNVWNPQQREFAVASDRGGTFALHEELLPGWEAAVDGSAVPITRWKGAFQAVTVAPGRHLVEFRYRSRSLIAGAWISLFSLAALAAIFLLPRRRA